MGNSPCYVVVDKTGKWVIVGNYGSGTLAVLPIQKDGSLGKAVTTIRHQGQGVDKERQEGPHVHSTVLSADNRYLFVADLGIDKEMIYAFNDKTGSLTPAREPFVKLQDGSGPRHFVFHPNGRWAYLTQEMTATVTALRYVNGGLHSVQTINSLPAGYKGPKRTADIHVSPDGKFLYSSDRDSANTIAIFKIDQNNGTLKLVGHQSVMGKTPRNFNFDPSGNYLLVANQNSDNIVVFQVDHQTGRLKYTGHQIPVGNPVCIKWISK
jgi:6-phosphogluconolactonase